MKASELMLGDYITLADCFNDGKETLIFKVVGLGYDGENSALVLLNGEKACDIVEIDDEWCGIPITPEILEKNGFTYCKSDGGFYLHTTISYGNWDVDVVLFDVTDEYRNNQLHISSPDDSYIAIHLMECNHVHELQHALRLCGIEKEIVI